MFETQERHLLDQNPVTDPTNRVQQVRCCFNLNIFFLEKLHIYSIMHDTQILNSQKRSLKIMQSVHPSCSHRLFDLFSHVRNNKKNITVTGKKIGI